MGLPSRVSRALPRDDRTLWRRATGHFAFLTTGVVLARLVNFVMITVVARRLGPASFADFSFVLAIFIAYGLIANLGLENLIVREVARSAESGRAIMEQALGVKLLALPVGVALVLVIGWYDPSLWRIAWALFLYGQLHAELLFLYALFRGQEKMHRQMILVVLQALFIASLSIVALFWRPSAESVSVAHAVGGAVPLAIGWWWVARERLLPQRLGERHAVGRLLRTTVPFAFSILGLLIFDRHAILFVEAFASREALGWYNAVYLVILALSQLPLIAINGLFPLLAQRAQDGARLLPIVRRAWGLLTVLGVAVALALFASAPWLIPLIFGAAYRPAATIMQILALSIPAIFSMILLNGLLQAVDQQRMAGIAFAVGLLIACPLTAFLAARYGYLGGAVGYTIAAYLIGLLLAIFTGRIVTMPRPASQGVR